MGVPRFLGAATSPKDLTIFLVTNAFRLSRFLCYPSRTTIRPTVELLKVSFLILGGAGEGVVEGVMLETC